MTPNFLHTIFIFLKNIPWTGILNGDGVANVGRRIYKWEASHKRSKTIRVVFKTCLPIWSPTVIPAGDGDPPTGVCPSACLAGSSHKLRRPVPPASKREPPGPQWACSWIAFGGSSLLPRLTAGSDGPSPGRPKNPSPSCGGQFVGSVGYWPMATTDIEQLRGRPQSRTALFS